MLETIGIGASLREARVQRGLTLEAIESGTRIRRRYLEAIEDELWDELPAEAYAKGFLRTYASFLELDPQQYLTEFRARRREVEEPIAPHPQPPYQPRPARLVALVAGAGLVLLVLALGAWKLTGDEPARRAPASTATASPAPAAPAGPVRAAPAVAAAVPLVLRATEDTWLEVRFAGPKGKRVWSGTLRQGRTLRVGLGRPLWLQAGKPEALRAALGTQPVGVPDGTTFTATRAGLRAAR